MDELRRLYMLQICDSLFPIGAFTLSNGLETFVQRGLIDAAEPLGQYLTDYLAVAPYQELGAMALAMQNAEDEAAWVGLDRLYTALRAPMEVRQGSAKLCMRLLKAAAQIAPLPILETYRTHIRQGDCTGQHPIAVGLFAAGHGVNAPGSADHLWLFAAERHDHARGQMCAASSVGGTARAARTPASTSTSGAICAGNHTGGFGRQRRGIRYSGHAARNTV